MYGMLKHELSLTLKNVIRSSVTCDITESYVAAKLARKMTAGDNGS